MLTETGIAKLKPRPKEFFVSDAGATGLSLRVSPKGKKTWCMSTVFPGSKCPAARSLGVFPSLGVAEAREKARKWYELVKQGRDPREVEEAERREREAAEEAGGGLRRQSGRSVAMQRERKEHPDAYASYQAA
jgi:hypothetical protein